MRLFLSTLAFLWLAAEWALALPPLLHDGFWPWHLAALHRLQRDAAFQLVTLDYSLCYAVALGVSVRDARQQTKHWGWWAGAFLLFTAPALLLYWSNRAGKRGAGGEPKPGQG